ncbi:MAG: hypothetical protein OHK93_005625 [Ramalina farinacea]|uniref:t-SNARE coiled-coil homology domain-containing protein n=1 Tax=Ramalina farinacea TaxID=258253 RepID=A0AA43QIK4_9LECA|nr:hypothetical protein [Ramalina farinacea]
MTNASQLYLLADHIKLSLLERQRAISLNLEPSSQDGHISRSLDQMREGIESIERERGDSSDLRTQYDDLTSQFQGFPSQSTSSTISHPNDPSLSNDFAHAKKPPTRPRIPSSSSFKRAPNSASPNLSKSVRFRDNPSPSPPFPHTTTTNDDDDQDAANRAALFPYRDDPSAADEQRPDHAQLDNQQIHAYHKNIIQQQDNQLDRLGESIGRQRDLSIQIGDELDGQIEMLDDVEGHMDRHQGRLDGARRQLEHVYRKSRENWGITVIAILVVILILLVIILKN